MLYSTALGFYKTGQAIARALGIKPQAVYQWKKSGVVPLKSATRLQTDSRGRIKVDTKLYEPKGAPSRV